MPGFVQTKGRGWVGEGTGAQQNRFRSAFHMFALFFFLCRDFHTWAHYFHLTEAGGFLSNGAALPCISFAHSLTRGGRWSSSSGFRFS